MRTHRSPKRAPVAGGGAISRRRFLKETGGGVAALGAGAVLPIRRREAHTSRTAVGQVAVLVDTTRCVGCMVCVEACKRKNGLPIEETWPTDMSPKAYTYVRRVRGQAYYAKRQCMNCVDPACVSVCPVAAMRKSKLGPVYYDAARCIGCRYCQQACPFQVPRYEWSKRWPKVTKCNMCRDWVEDGRQTACVSACPFNALHFGPREEMLAEAHRRIKDHPGRYVDHVYGEHEVGGTDFLYLTSEPFEDLGLKELPEEALPKLTWDDTVKMPWVIGIGIALMTGAYFETRGHADETEEESAPGDAETPPSEEADDAGSREDTG